jgi:hypothetical protein
MTDSNLIKEDENTVPEGAFGIGSKKTDQELFYLVNKLQIKH